MNTQLLGKLYEKYDIANLSYGKVHDKLGDVYEEYCITILSDKTFLTAAKEGQNLDSTEFKIYKSILDKAGFSDLSAVKEITATNIVPHRATHGNSKTDVIATIIFNDGTEAHLPISSKQSYVHKVAVAEFDVDTICHEAKIDDERVKSLMLKFQEAKSAKGLTDSEKKELRELIKPYAKNLVRWAITGSPDENTGEVIFPKLLVKFEIVKPKDRYNIHTAQEELHFKSCSVYTIDEYVDLTIYDKSGNIKAGGFGTGLSWTYASGSGGKKIQFKA